MQESLLLDQLRSGLQQIRSSLFETEPPLFFLAPRLRRVDVSGLDPDCFASRQEIDGIAESTLQKLFLRLATLLARRQPPAGLPEIQELYQRIGGFTHAVERFRGSAHFGQIGIGSRFDIEHQPRRLPRRNDRAVNEHSRGFR
ncbi:MAG: hypothetical protein ABSA49_19215 [Rhizomicrobium sp.]